MNTDTAITLALHDVETREEILDVTRVLCAAGSFAQATGGDSLRDRLIGRGATVLAIEITTTCPRT